MTIRSNVIECTGGNMKRRYFLGLALAAAATPLTALAAGPRERVLRLHHMHTDERLEVTYRIGDRYQPQALQRLNHFLRDFRTNDTMVMDPRLFDFLHDVSARLGDPGARFEVLSAYRSPATNSMLRKTSSGVAKNSLHLTGQAIDIRLPGVTSRLVRDTAIGLNRGGVGYYQRSDFVHLDTGKVRCWGA